MNELIKNIGLDIFVNGAYAWQFTESHTKGILAIIEGISYYGNNNLFRKD